VLASSSNQTLLPDSGISISSGCGNSTLSCTATLATANGQAGAATLSLTVTDAQGRTAVATVSLQVAAATSPPPTEPPTGSASDGGGGGGGGGSLDFLSLLALVVAMRRSRIVRPRRVD
jgi:hypothetical protein